MIRYESGSPTRGRAFPFTWPVRHPPIRLGASAARMPHWNGIGTLLNAAFIRPGWAAALSPDNPPPGYRSLTEATNFQTPSG